MRPRLPLFVDGVIRDRPVGGHPSTRRARGSTEKRIHGHLQSSAAGAKMALAVVHNEKHESTS